MSFASPLFEARSLIARNMSMYTLNKLVDFSLKCCTAYIFIYRISHVEGLVYLIHARKAGHRSLGLRMSKLRCLIFRFIWFYFQRVRCKLDASSPETKHSLFSTIRKNGIIELSRSLQNTVHKLEPVFVLGRQFIVRNVLRKSHRIRILIHHRWV